MATKKRLYLAAPLFNAQEKAFNVELKQILSAKYQVFLPQEDGHLLVNLLEKGDDVTKAVRKVFMTDVEAVKKSDVIFAVLDGRTIDEGVAFELGLAHGLNIPCYGYQTDVRRLWPPGNNPMIDETLTATFHSLDEVAAWIENTD